MKKLFYTLLLLAAICIPVNGFAADIVPAADADAAHIISKAAERYIDTKNKELSSKCNANIVIATVNSLSELTIGEYAKELFKTYRLNSGKKSNSVLVVFCTEKNDYTVVVADGISGSLTMQTAEQYLTEYTEKDFAKKNYSKAAVKTYNGIAKWYNDNYNNLDISLTDDISEYAAAVKSEQQNQHRRAVNRKIILSVTAAAVLIILFYTKRRMRLIKARKKRNERKLRYMRGIRNS